MTISSFITVTVMVVLNNMLFLAVKLCQSAKLKYVIHWIMLSRLVLELENYVCIGCDFHQLNVENMAQVLLVLGLTV